jgi:hypothetical protein
VLSRGFTSTEKLLGLVVLLIAVGVVALVALSMNRRDRVSRDVSRMRTLYISAAMYESDNNGVLPPDLGAARTYVPESLAYQATGDPFVGVNAEGYPIDAGLPDGPATSPVRISYTYLYALSNAGKAKAKPWSELKFDPKVGLLANEWEGSVSAAAPFHAQVSGKLLRLNTDGSLHTLNLPDERQLGDAEKVFYSKG